MVSSVVCLLAGLAITTAQITFTGIPTATGDLRHDVIATDSMTYMGETKAVSYHIIARSNTSFPLMGGATDSEWPLGLITDESGNGVYIADETTGMPSWDLDVSPHPDFTSLWAGDMEGDVWMITVFEANPPSAMYISKLSQDMTSCNLTVKEIKPVDWSAYGGLHNPCAGSVTPWGTYLGSEEYEPDARVFVDTTKYPTLDDVIGTDSGSGAISFARYYDLYPADIMTTEDLTNVYNPYLYGFLTEVSIDSATGDYKNWKHYATGRMSHELGMVMPDNRTVYLTDDGTNVIFGAFVMTTANDMSSGELFAAHMTQDMTSTVPGGSFAIDWISLGVASHSDVVPYVNTTTFWDIFSAEEPVDGVCPTAGYTSINVGGYGQECLMVNAGMEMIASRLETRRYAAMLGATTEGSKWEGITFDADNMMLYTSITAVRYGMEDNAKKGEAETEYDIGANNDIKLPYNDCGCVYQLAVTMDNGWYQATSFEGFICGTPITTDPDNTCDLNGISSPDNVNYHDGTLFIAEDTSGHQNNVMWAVSTTDPTKTLTRIFSVPYGAEVTSAYWHVVNGCDYMMALVQHPYEGLEDTLALEPAATGTAGWIGYIG